MADSETLSIDANKMATSVLLAGATFLLLLLVLYFTLKNDFWAGIVSFSCSYILAISSYIYLNRKK
jgi:hypothetical protein